MAHHIEKDDRFGFVGDKAWHGIGLRIPEGQTATEVFPAIGLDWETELVPIFAQVQVGEEDGCPVYRRIELPEHRAHIRLDTYRPLGVVGQGYEQITNRDFAAFVDQIAGQDAAITVNTAGSLYGGKRIFCLVKLPHVIKVGADINEQYILVSNGHGGFASFSVYPTSIRVVCDNTLRWSERDAGKGITFRHSGDIDDKIQQARITLGLAVEESKRFEEKVIALANTDLSAGQIRDFMHLAYVKTFGSLPDAHKQPEAFEKLKAKRDEIVEKWIANMEDERQLVAGIQGTAWAALNAVTQWHDHERGRFKSARESDARLHSNLFGASNKDKQKTFQVAMQLVGK